MEKPASSVAEVGPGTAGRTLLVGIRRAAAAIPVLGPAAVVGDPIEGSPLVFVLCAGLVLVVALGVLAGARGSRASSATGLGLALLGAWLITEASFSGSMLVAGCLLAGASALLLAGAKRADWRTSTISVDAAAGIIIGSRIAWGIEGGAIAAAALAAGSAAATMFQSGPAIPRGFVATAVPVLAVLYGGFSVGWVGSTSPTATWFGGLTSHGSRSSNEVALTFDDGPNGDDTLAIAAILEADGIRGTFFIVGKALKKEPEVARELLAHGHTLGNHSYDHDAYSYLDPRYPELDKTQRVFAETIGTCPALFRPPHGTHTPFMSGVVDDAGMSLITWDVSARDWVEDDADRLARNILAKARPGSIILLHDGIDGIPGADRSVVVRALPAIIEGLQARGLQPVTVDRLLGVPAYLSSCP